MPWYAWDDEAWACRVTRVHMYVRVYCTRTCTRTVLVIGNSYIAILQYRYTRTTRVLQYCNTCTRTRVLEYSGLT